MCCKTSIDRRFPGRSPQGSSQRTSEKISLNTQHTNTNKPMYASAHVGSCEQQSAHSYRNSFTTCATTAARQHAGWRHKSGKPSDSGIPSSGGFLFFFNTKYNNLLLYSDNLDTLYVCYICCSTNCRNEDAGCFNNIKSEFNNVTINIIFFMYS